MIGARCAVKPASQTANLPRIFSALRRLSGCIAKVIMGLSTGIPMARRLPPPIMGLSTGIAVVPNDGRNVRMDLRWAGGDTRISGNRRQRRSRQNWKSCPRRAAAPTRIKLAPSLGFFVHQRVSWAFPGRFLNAVSAEKQGNGNAETIEQSRTAEPGSPASRSHVGLFSLSGGSAETPPLKISTKTGRARARARDYRKRARARARASPRDQGILEILERSRLSGC
jgi:hypothetical protein